MRSHESGEERVSRAMVSTWGRPGLAAWAATMHLALVCALTPAAGAEQREHDLTELSLEELMNVEVTSASRKPEKRSVASDAIYVITGDDIRRSGVRTIPDALRLAPGVHVAKIDANKWAIGIRGFPSRLSRAVLVLIDGRSVYTPLFAGTYWEVQDTVLDDIDRIEVIRGPGGTLWGANAVDGVINIITKHSKDTQGLFVTAGGGNEERGFGTVRWGGAIGENLHYRAYGKYFDRDGGHNPDGPSYDDWHLSREGFRVDWNATPRDTVRLHGDVYDGDAGHQTVISSLTEPFNRTVRDHGTLSGANVVGAWNHFFNEDSDLQLQAYFDNSFRREPNFHERRNTWDVDFQHRIVLPWSQELIWGLEYRHTEDRTGGVDTVVFDPPTRADDLYSGFIQDEVRLLDGEVRIVVGSKLEHNDYSGFEVQPNVRLAWVPNVRHLLWASVARAVRTPSRVDDDLQLTAFVESFDSFIALRGDDRSKAEKVTAYETGYRVQPWHPLFLDLALFYNQYDDLESLEPGAPEPGPSGRSILPLTPRNRFHGRTYGAELGADAEVRSWWRLHAVYSLLQVDLEPDPGSGDTLTEGSEDDSPHHQLTFRSAINLPSRSEFDAVLRYVDNIAQTDVASYVELDLRVAKRFGEHLELSVVGLNLLHDHHREFGGGTEVQRSVYGQVRFWW